MTTDEMTVEMARLHAHLNELRGLYTGALTRLGLLCGALGLPADEPGIKLAAQARRMREAQAKLVDAAEAVCDCAQQSLGGNWFVLDREFMRLQGAVNCAAAAPTTAPVASLSEKLKNIP